jgi:hypothetical protein
MTKTLSFTSASKVSIDKDEMQVCMSVRRILLEKNSGVFGVDAWSLACGRYLSTHSWVPP